MIFYFFELLKPKIILANWVSLCSGYFLGSRGNLNFKLFFFNSLCLFLVVASSCILNNVIDRKIDKFMLRTQHRILVEYTKYCNSVIIFSIIMFSLGICVCITFINILCCILYIIGWFVYVFIYSFLLKKKSAFSVVVGSISGALPPIIGYCSVINNLDVCVLYLFLMFAFWQIPHSYSLCIFYLEDYRMANIPIFPIIYGLKITQYNIVITIILFFIFSCGLFILNFLGYKYFIVLFVLCSVWLYYSCLKLTHDNSKLWAKKVFQWSIIVVFLLDVFISFDYIV
ncbi:MAG: heme o synthase [Buchnera aphidicola (Chaetogeoica yunlongensis)]